MQEQIKYDLELELKTCPWILEKVQDKIYAQHLYAALCNMQWQKTDTWTVLKNDMWSCTWRYAGGLVAELRDVNEGYLDWYCSGIKQNLRDVMDLTESEKQAYLETEAYVPEGIVTDEIKQDLKKLGWHPVPYEDD